MSNVGFEFTKAFAVIEAPEESSELIVFAFATKIIIFDTQVEAETS